MKTLTIEAKTLPMFDTLDELFEAARPHQVTGQEILNGRSRVFDQWQEIAISEELREQVINRIVDQSGGRHTTKAAVYRTLRNGRPQHWALSRFLLSKYGDRPAHLSYCAGQDMTYEMKQLRNDLK